MNNEKPNKTGIEALTIFIQNYRPAAVNEADVFFSTNEISQAIEEHTGVTLRLDEIYALMTQMGYQYQPYNGFEFRWMMREE